MLVIRNLTKTYKNGRGIRDINFSVAKGEVYGLLGPNGAGKTTFLKVASGLLKEDGGQCFIDSENENKSSLSYKKKTIGMIGDTVLYDYLSPMEHLKLMDLYRDRISEEDRNRVLKEVDLLSYKDEPVRDFSTGMKQRLAYAMCLITEPEVLLLDEPFSGLDIEGKILIRNSLMRLREAKSTAILISSHLIHDVEEIATTVGVIKEGRMIAEEKVSKVQRHYRNLEDYFIDETVSVKEGA